jgi:cation transport ATPase
VTDEASKPIVPSIAKVKLAVTNLYCACCTDELERVLSANPHVVSARVDYLAEQVEVAFDPGMLDEAEIQQLINQSRRCSCGLATAKDETTHLHHQAQMAPINMGTKHGRMQYELPASGVREAHEAGHREAASHGGMDHDMSDPKMAKAMELDMRNRGAGTDVAIETANVVLMKSDPLDVLRTIKLSKATVRKMLQNLFWASIYNVLAIPIAAGVLYPSLGIELRPEWAALLMSVSSIIVATNAVLLKRVEGGLAAA